MKVILLKEIQNLGKNGEIVQVANGYAKNYLFPKRIALLAVQANIKDIKNNNNIIDKNRCKELNSLDNTSVIIPVKLKDKENIYGSINSKSISKVFKQLNLQVNIKHLETDVLIRKVGKYKFLFNNKRYNIKTIIHVLLVEKK